MISESQILFIDNHLIAVHKPVGLLVQGDSSGDPSLFEMTKEWLKFKFNKPGEVYLGLLHRLDRPVSGVVLFARTSKAASRLSLQFREHSICKIYKAVVHGKLWPESGKLEHYLRKERSLKATVFPNPAPDAKRAELSYRTLEILNKASIVEIELQTGRFHQIRAQLSFSGCPILGDIKYRSTVTLPDNGIALFAHRLEFAHPVTGETIRIVAKAPQGWPFKVLS